MANDKVYDSIIVGAGPAGITASVYAARQQLNFLVITKDIGGQAALSGDVENYTGYQFISGPELSRKFEEHMRKYKITVRENEAVRQIERQDGGIVAKTEVAEYRSLTAIIASGKRSRELGVPGEKEFKNKGLTYCATCDGPLFMHKDVAVIGGGNSALDAALQLLEIANRIYLINNAAQLRGEASLRKKVISNKKVTVFNSSTVTEIIGDAFVTAMGIKTPEGTKTLPLQGVFVEIGLIPNSELCNAVAKDESGEIIVDNYNRTNIEGIFAAGDVTNVPEKQIIIAAGEGSKAALSAFRYLATRP